MDMNSLIGLLGVVILVAANGFFVAAEFALVKVRSTRIEQLVTEGNRTARVVQTQVQQLDTYIAATQLGITLASLALGWIGEPSLAHLIEPLFASIGGQAAETLSHTLAVAISFAVITSLHIVMGELVPKSIALQRSEATSLFVARPLWLFARLLSPFIYVMNGIGNSIVRLLGMRAAHEHSSIHSVEELEMLVAQSRQGGILDVEEEKMLYHVFEFGEKSVHQVMKPRSELAALPTTSSLEQIQTYLVQEQYTRLPIYENTLDSVVGMIHLKDLFAWQQKHSGTPFVLEQILRPVLYVTLTTSIETTLRDMRNKRIHLAIIIDEYGSTAGMVTLEDIVEEIVGEVHDEFDTQERGVRDEVETQRDGSLSIDGLMSIQALTTRLGLAEPVTTSKTVGGFVQEHLGRLAHLGDQVLLDTYQLTVESMDGRRVARVQVVPQASSTPSGLLSSNQDHQA